MQSGRVKVNAISDGQFYCDRCMRKKCELRTLYVESCKAFLVDSETVLKLCKIQRKCLAILRNFCYSTNALHILIFRFDE